jgi:hypothetical protein
MKIKLGYSMGYAGTESEWTEDIPEDVIEEGQEAIAWYVERAQDEAYLQACEKISVWAEIVE